LGVYRYLRVEARNGVLNNFQIVPIILNKLFSVGPVNGGRQLRGQDGGAGRRKWEKGGLVGGSAPSAPTGFALQGVIWLGLSSCALLCPAQAPMDQGGRTVRINNSDLAVLEAQEIRKDLPCTVTPSKPELGFDLKFHIRYDVNVPLADLAGGENQLTILFRVTAANRKDQPRFFVQRVHVPLLDEDARGDATLSGSLDLGEGNYHVDWLMRDRAERVCSFYWDSEAILPPRDRQIQVALSPGVVESSEAQQFTEEPPVERATGGPPLNIKVLVNFAPQNADSPSLRPSDTTALVTMLRQISREPQFGKFSLVAYNIQEQRILYRQSSADRIDFPALGDAVQSIKLGTVDYQKLGQKHGEMEFLAGLIRQEMSGDHPDALIFAGPKIMLDESVPDDQLKPFAADLDFPVFYVNYALNPQATPWRDSIGHAVKLFRGTEYTISRPRDLWFSVTEMVSRIVKFKHGRSSASSSGQ